MKETKEDTKDRDLEEIISVAVYTHGYEANLEGRFIGLVDKDGMDFLINVRDWEVIKRMVNKDSKDFTELGGIWNQDIEDYRIVLLITKSDSEDYKAGEIFVSDNLDMIAHADDDSVFLHTKGLYIAMERM